MRTATILLLATIAIAVIGCGGSSGQSPLAPDLTNDRVAQTGDSHNLWGLWQFIIDPETGTLDAIPLRTAAMHLNAVPLLEPPAGLNLKISNLSFNGTICDVDVTLKHPYPGLGHYTGFDVTGILFTNGSTSGFQDPDLIMAGPGESRLLNPDGYTRWWNPAEFDIPGQPVFRYRDGLLGQENEVAHFNATLNGYKVFCDGLGADDDVLTLGPETRAPFPHGTSNTRHYTIDFAGGIIFNYAVDACWNMPMGLPPYTVDDFPESANRPEAWAVSVTEVENMLYNDGTTNGGNLNLLIDVWDHYNPDLNILWIDSPGNFGPVTVTDPITTGEGYATYEVQVQNATPDPDSIDILIGVECEAIGYADVLPDDTITGYFIHTSVVSDSPVGSTPVASMHATTSTEIDLCNDVSFDASESTGDPPLTFEWDFNGDDIYDGPEDNYIGDPITPTHTFTQKGYFNVTVKVSNTSGFDISDPVEISVGNNVDGIYVDADYTGGGSDGTMDKPFTTIQQAMSVATSGQKIHVDYYSGSNNIYDTAGLVLKSGVMLLGDNWQDCSQPKPKASCATSGKVFFGQNVINVLIEGFEIIVPAGPFFPSFTGQPTICGVNFKDTNANSGGGSTNYNTVRRCRFTGTMTVSAGFWAIYLEGAVGTTVELNEFGNINGVGSSNFWAISCVYSYRSDSNTITQNWVHDLTANVSTNSGAIEIFHLLWGDDAKVSNNLIHSVEAVNGYCNIWAVYIDGQPGDAHSNDPIVTNNTVDDMQTNGYGFANMIGFSNTIVGTFAIPNVTLYNNIVSNTGGSASSRAYEFTQPDPSDPCIAEFCNAYNTAWLSSGGAEGYLYITKGTGCYGNWTNPQDPDYINEPTDYDLSSSSTSQYGNPDIVDWDDTGSPSNDPDDHDTNTRSRMGAFGGPDGNWWPLD